MCCTSFNMQRPRRVVAVDDDDTPLSPEELKKVLAKVPRMITEDFMEEGEKEEAPVPEEMSVATSGGGDCCADTVVQGQDDELAASVSATADTSTDALAAAIDAVSVSASVDASTPSGGLQSDVASSFTATPGCVESTAFAAHSCASGDSVRLSTGDVAAEGEAEGEAPAPAAGPVAANDDCAAEVAA